MSYWDAYNLPIPIRKYYIQRWNKRMAEQNKDSNTPSTDEPLSKSQRMKMIKDAQQANNPANTSSYMQPRRNK